MPCRGDLQSLRLDPPMPPFSTFEWEQNPPTLRPTDMNRNLPLSILFWLATALSAPAAAPEHPATREPDGSGYPGDTLGAGEIPWYDAAWKTALLPAWNSFETGENGLGVLQAVADGAALAGLTLSIASGDATSEFPILLAVSLGLAWFNRVISLPVNLLSTLQYNSELRAGPAMPSGYLPDLSAGRVPSPATFRRFGLGFGAGNVDGFAREHAYWVGSFTLQGRRYSLTATARVETPDYYFEAVPGQYRVKAEETFEYALVPEYRRVFPGNWFGKGGLGLSLSHFNNSTWTAAGWTGPVPETPEWDRVWRVEPVLTAGRAFWDNKFTLEASLGFTAWDSRYVKARERDDIPFGWGLPVEPAFRVFYWL